MKSSNLTPTRLRLILIGCMVALVALSVVVFMIGYKQLSDYSASARTVAAQAQASNSSLQNLVAVKKELETDKDIVERASQIVAESKSYLYQDQIIQDINNIASASGITITNISFGDSGSPTSSGTPAAASTTTPTANPGASAATAAGVKTTTATVTVKNPVGYDNMLSFIHAIESSLFKMRISQITLSKPTDAKNPNDVTTDALTIEVYIR